jgi:quercetin dioxygenase-like cupin family protein/N-acetylglutamate synthase-like GNAT family acetyltransferase
MVLNHEHADAATPAAGIARRLLVHGPGLMLIEFTFDANTDLPIHTHPHEQVGYVVSGRLRLSHDGAFHELGPGDSYHVLPNVPHGAYVHEPAVVVDVFTPPRQDFLPAAIRPCTAADFDAIHEIINDAAQAYKGVIPPDRWHEPYMSREELQNQLAQTVVFYGYEAAGQLTGVMGIQHVEDVTLIRHAYVRTRQRQQGIGGKLLAHLRTLTSKPVLIGTWADAAWAIRFYEKHGFKLVDRARVPALLNRYWGVPQRQVEASVVLTDGRL